MLSTILVPLDGSQLAEKALPFARRMADAAGARVVLVRVIPEFSVPDQIFDPTVSLAAYEYLVRVRTTTDLDARTIHAIGQREVARLRAAMEEQMKLVGFTGSFVEFIKFLNSDPRFFHPTAEALLMRYRDIAKRVDPELPKLFAQLPRTPYGVRAIPAHQGPDIIPSAECG